MINNQLVAASTSLVAGVAVLAYFGFQFLQKKKIVKIPTEWEEIGTLSGVFIYPLKSGHRKELSEAECTRRGLKQTKEDEKALQLRDRSLTVYSDKDKEFRTGRTHPQMLQIEVSSHDENHFALDAPTMRTLYVRIPTKQTNKVVTVTLHEKEPCEAIDCGDEAATWLSRLLLQKADGLRLAYHEGINERTIETALHHEIVYYKNVTNYSSGLFADLSSLSVINQQSINDLCEKIGNGTLVTVNNFRPNLVVNGRSIKPFDEDNWEWIKIGDVVLRNVKEIARCMMTTINPETSIRDTTMQPLKTLKTYRTAQAEGAPKQPIMGVNVEVRQSGILKLGDTVYVHRFE